MISVLSLNLHGFQEKSRQKKLNKIIDFINDHHVDVCLFQEAVSDPETGECNVEYIAKKTGYNLYFHKAKKAYEKYDEGLAILSCHDIENPNYLTISNSFEYENWAKRDLVFGEILGLKFYTVHIGWKTEGEEPMSQIDNVVDVLKDSLTPCILAGDFNHSYGTNEITYLTHNLFQLNMQAGLNPYNNPTFHYELDSQAPASNKMIDYCFSNQKMDLGEFRLVFDEEKDFVSDHSGIYFEILNA